MDKRIFLSTSLPKSIYKTLSGPTAFLCKNSDLTSARWTKEENLHLTLYFLGNVKEELIPELIEELNKNLNEIKSFNLKFEKITFAPENNRARMIWAQFHVNENFKRLYAKIKQVSKKFTCADNEKNKNLDLIPHITLARLKTPIKNSQTILNQPQIPDLKVDHFNLMESQLDKNGPTYKNLAIFKLSLR